MSGDYENFIPIFFRTQDLSIILSRQNKIRVNTVSDELILSMLE